MVTEPKRLSTFVPADARREALDDAARRWADARRARELAAATLADAVAADARAAEAEGTAWAALLALRGEADTAQALVTP